MPRRRCVGCGRIAPKSELVRLAATDRKSASEPRRGARRVAIDPAGTLPGRGAYLCRGSDAMLDARCLELARRRGGIARTLRCAVKLDLEKFPVESPEFVESVSQ